MFPLRALLAFDIALAVFGPAIVILLFAIQSLIAYNRRHRQNGAAHTRMHHRTWNTMWNWFIDMGWLRSVWKWAKFWLAVVISVGLQVLLVVGYLNLNPYVSSPQSIDPYNMLMNFLETGHVLPTIFGANI